MIDLVGSSQSARVGYDSLIKGGKYVIVGLYGGDLTVSLPPIPMRALTIQGSYVGSLPEMKELIDLVRRTGLPPVPVATRPLEDVNAVMDELRAGKMIGRVVLTPALTDCHERQRVRDRPGAFSGSPPTCCDGCAAHTRAGMTVQNAQCPPIFISRSH